MHAEGTGEVVTTADMPHLALVGFNPTSYQPERNISALINLIDNLRSNITYLQSGVEYVPETFHHIYQRQECLKTYIEDVKRARTAAGDVVQVEVWYLRCEPRRYWRWLAEE